MAPRKPVPPEDVSSITLKIARYARYHDTKQWGKLRSEILHPTTFTSTSYTPSGSIAHAASSGGQPLAFNTPRSHASFYESYFRHKQCHHLVGPGEFSQGESPDEIKAVFAMQEVFFIPPFGELWGFKYQSGGFWHARWERLVGEEEDGKEGGGWYLVDLKVQRTFEVFGFGVWVVGLLVRVWTALWSGGRS